MREDIYMNTDTCKLEVHGKLGNINLYVPGNINWNKMEKYSALCADIFQAGWICHLNAIEIGARGLITKQNKADLRGLLKPLKKQKPRHVLANLSKLAVLGSYKLFLSRKEEWISPGTMKITW